MTRTFHHWTAQFLREHPVFRTEQFLAAAPSSRATAHALLRDRRTSGMVRNIRRGLWATVDPRAPLDPDPVLVAAAITADAIVCMHTALALRGFAYSIRRDVTYYSRTPATPLDLDGAVIRGLPHPHALVERSAEQHDVEAIDHLGTSINATSVERSLVDMLDRPELNGGIEEIWRTASQVGFLDDRRLLAYLELRGSATLAARTGYVLEQLDTTLVPPAAIEQVRTLALGRSGGPFELDPRSTEPRTYVHRWRLLVPGSVATRAWQEPGW